MLKRRTEVLASVSSLPERRLRARAGIFHCLSPTAWCRRLGPKSDVEHIVVRAVHAMCNLFIWVESRFLDDARWSASSVRSPVPGRIGLSLFLGQVGFFFSLIQP